MIASYMRGTHEVEDAGEDEDGPGEFLIATRKVTRIDVAVRRSGPR